jgi:spermidine/putrescine transport system substrate-binding protein
MNRPLPQDPMVRQLVQMARKHQMSRRTLLAGAGGSAVAMGLAACAGGSNLEAPEDISASDPTLNWSNWPFYIDEDDDGNFPTLERFQQETGITVNYNVNIDGNNSWFATVRDQVALGQDIGADLACPTEWMVSRWVNLGYTQEFNEANMPNKANLVEALQNPDFDPGRKRSLPWQGGFTGIAYNTDLTDEIRTIDDLWRPDLRGRVVLLDEMRDTMALLMGANGADIENFTSDDFYEALDVLNEQVAAGQVRNVRGNAYTEDLTNEDALAAIGWSGDITILNFEAGYEKWKFVFPESGGNIWTDTFIVPIGSPRKTNAETLMNYYYQPDVAAEVAAWVNFVTPVEGAYEEAMKIDPELADNTLIFPDDETLSKVKAIRTLTPEEDNEFQAAFQATLLGA